MFSCAVSADGSLYTWGNNDDYQLGDGTKHSRYTPKVVEEVKDVVQGSCSRGFKYHHMSCLTTEGVVYSWGSAYKGKLGDSKLWSHKEPTH